MAEIALSTDEQMMWQVCQTADPQAFAHLMGRWQGPIQRLCVRMLGDFSRAEELSQETFVRVFTRRHQFLSDHRFSTWLWRIAVNLCYDELRRRQRTPELSVVAEASEDAESMSERQQFRSNEPTPDESAIRLERAERVRGALQRLPETYRAVVVLRHYEGLKCAEIGEVLGIPEGTVKSRLSEGLTRLGRTLNSIDRA